MASPPTNSGATLIVYLLQAIGIQGDLDRLAREATDRFAGIDMTYHCPEAGYRMLAELRARGYKLGLITNRSNVREILRTAGPDGYARLL